MCLFCLLLLAVPSVVKKDTTPTDAPKGTWPFSVDSDSSWSQLGAAQGALSLGPTPGHPRERALNCVMPVLVQLWLGLAGRHTGVYHSVGLCLPVSLSFCCNFFFFNGTCTPVAPSQHHVCLGINTSCLGLPAHHPLGRGGICGEGLMLSSCV